MSSGVCGKPHAVCIPFPAQGHVTPMLALAKLLHSSGFHITFVNTECNHRRLLRSLGPTSLTGIPDFQFAMIPDGIPSCHNEDAIDDLVTFIRTVCATGLPHLNDLLDKLNTSCSDIPRVTCVVADSCMYYALDAAKKIEVPCVLFWTSSPGGFMGGLQFKDLINRGLVPLKDLSQISNGFLDTTVDWVPGMTNMRLRDFPAFIRTTDINDVMFNLSMDIMECQSRASAIIMNTFHELNYVLLDALKFIIAAPIYAVGPLPVLEDHIVTGSMLKSLNLNLWKEEHGCLQGRAGPGCLELLEEKKAASVVYVNFGSLIVMTHRQLVELAWGLANSKYPFVLILRPDLVRDSDKIVLPQEFLEEVKERSFIASWCPQMAVLRHKAIGLFLTHSEWNSTLESICNGVPMLSWPYGGDQPTVCRYICSEWKIGMEIDNDFNRYEVKKLVREMVEGEEGKRMKERAMQWKQSIIRATQHDGSSFLDFQKLLHEVLLKK